MASKRLRWASNIKQWNQNCIEWCHAMSCVQAEERTRINQFVFSDDATLSLVGRLLLRAAIAQLLSVSNELIVFGRTDKGRPYLVSPPVASGYDVNVSHQGSYAVLAAERNRRVGVDIMQLTRPRGIGTLQQFFWSMDRQFTVKEWQQIQAPPTDEEKLAMFYRHWCLKESYIKSIGIGLSHGLQRIEFKLSHSGWGHHKGVWNNTQVSVDNVTPTRNWVFEESFLDSEHCVAVAIEQYVGDEGDAPLPFEEVSVPCLLSELNQLREPDQSDWLLQAKRPGKSFSLN